MFTYMLKDIIYSYYIEGPDPIGILVFLLGCILTVPVDLVLLPLELLTGIIYFVGKKRRKDD